jgi:hypothetical protein
MPIYSFRIFRGQKSNPDLTKSLPNKLAAKKEALTICSDLVRDIVSKLEPNIAWRLDVADQDGNCFFRVQVSAEEFE